MVVYSNELSNEALLLASYLKNDFAVEVTLEEGKDKGDVILLLDSTVLPDKKGGYVLEAAGSRITIKASTPEGVFNGVQTLRQIIPPFKRDILKELAEECQKQGIKLHFYYSHLDWFRDDYPSSPSRAAASAAVRYISPTRKVHK